MIALTRRLMLAALAAVILASIAVPQQRSWCNVTAAQTNDPSIAANGPVPGYRGHGQIWVPDASLPLGGKVFLFGGETTTLVAQDTWRLYDPVEQNWNAEAQSSPAVGDRANIQLVRSRGTVDSAHENRIWIFGGDNLQGSQLDTLWHADVDVVNDSVVFAYNSSFGLWPPPLSDYAAGWDSTSKRCVYVGDSPASTDTWCYSPDAGTWSQYSSSIGNAVTGGTIVEDGVGTLLLFGCHTDAGVPVQKTWKWNTSTNSWDEQMVTNPGTGYCRAGGAWDPVQSRVVRITGINDAVSGPTGAGNSSMAFWTWESGTGWVVADWRWTGNNEPFWEPRCTFVPTPGTPSLGEILVTGGRRQNAITGGTLRINTQQFVITRDPSPGHSYELGDANCSGVVTLNKLSEAYLGSTYQLQVSAPTLVGQDAYLFFGWPFLPGLPFPTGCYLLQDSTFSAPYLGTINASGDSGVYSLPIGAAQTGLIGFPMYHQAVVIEDVFTLTIRSSPIRLSTIRQSM